MTDIDPTLHPGHKDAGKDAEAVRGALRQLRHQAASILHGYGVKTGKVTRLDHTWGAAMEQLLREVEEANDASR